MPNNLDKDLKQYCINKINNLLKYNSTKRAKYLRNYKWYSGDPSATFDTMTPNIIGYQLQNYSQNLNDDTPKFNVIKSIIDTIVSKISTARCRPYVNTVEGSYKDFIIGKSVQLFMDNYSDEHRINKVVTDCLRDACIFDTGYIYYNSRDMSIERLEPWNVYLSPLENRASSDLKTCYIEWAHIPPYCINDIPDEIKDLESCTYGVYHDTVRHITATLYNRKIYDISEWNDSNIPIIPLYYTQPLCGISAMGVTDMLTGIQSQLDILMRKYAEAARLNPAMTIVLNNASNIKVGQLNNQIGNVLQYNGDNSAMQTITPNFISDQYQAEIQNLISMAYDIVGVSQLSAQSKKPSDVSSGVALATLEDIESDRFEDLLRSYIGMFTQLARLILATNADFIPNEKVVDQYSITWSDVGKAMKKIKLQFSAADSLSKDPSEKLKQLQMLSQAGLIPATHIGQLMNMPDLNTGMNMATNCINAVDALIDNVLSTGEIPDNIPPYISYQLVKEEILSTQLMLSANLKDNSKDIELLNKLFDKAIEMSNDIEELVPPTPAQNQVPPQGGEQIQTVPNSGENMNLDTDVVDSDNGSASIPMEDNMNPSNGANMYNNQPNVVSGEFNTPLETEER